MNIPTALFRGVGAPVPSVGRQRVWNVPRSVRLNARELHHLGPFLDFFGDELAEVDGRACKCLVTQIGEVRLDPERAAVISPLSFAMISAGVPFGAPNPFR